MKVIYVNISLIALVSPQPLVDLPQLVNFLLSVDFHRLVNLLPIADFLRLADLLRLVGSLRMVDSLRQEIPIQLLDHLQQLGLRPVKGLLLVLGPLPPLHYPPLREILPLLGLLQQL